MTAKSNSSEGQLRPTSCACAAARRASRAVTQLYDLVLAPTRLKATQVVILQAIEDHGEVCQTVLSTQYAVTPETLSRRLAKLRNLGLIVCRPGTNRSERLYSLTPEGKEALHCALPYWARAQERLVQSLAGTDITDLQAAIRVLDVITAAALDAAWLRMPNRASSPSVPTEDVSADSEAA